VTEVVSGYAGGSAARPGGAAGPGSGFAEAVRIRFDPSQVSYEQLLAIYFQVAHDPTQLNRQGPDVGPRYRSAIFPQTEAQKTIATEALAKLRSSRAFARPVVTRLEVGAFKVAGPEHQDYMRRNPGSRYVIVHDLPKLAKLKRTFPGLWRA
jgi:peptide-methionine (S)-S-oxide reductase